MPRGRKKAGLLANWNKARETTENESPMGDPVPLEPGQYVMQLVDVAIDDFADKRQVMLKWAVLGEDEDAGTICTEWEGIYDADRLVWLQRKLSALGVDLSDLSVETEDDLKKLFDELIDEGLAAKVRVKEKDGYINMQTRQAVDVDESELFDPDEVLKQKKGSSTSSKGKGKGSKKKEEEPEEVDFKEGDEVTWEKDGKTFDGKIVDFTEDDEAKVKVEGRKRPMLVSCDALSYLEEEEEKEDKKEESQGSDFKRADFEVGDRVLVDFGKDGQVEAEVTSVPPRGDSIQITPDDTKEPEMVEASEVVEKLEEEKPKRGRRGGKKKEEEPEDDDKGSEEWEEGDPVLFKDGRKQHEGVVKSINGRIAKVKVVGIRKPFDVPLNELEEVK